MQSIIVAMLLAGGILLGGCADRSAKTDPNATAKTQKKTVRTMPQPQERYGFAPIGE